VVRPSHRRGRWTIEPGAAGLPLRRHRLEPPGSPRFVIRYARRHLGFLAGLVIAAVVMGVGYRYLFDPLEERVPSYYLRSCLHAIGLAISGWAVHVSLAAAPRSRLSGRLRRLPQIAELAIKVLVMTTVLTIVAVGLELVLYPAPFLSQLWLIHELPRITSFFFDIDRPIAEYDGEVHAYVGDEVIVTWPLSDDPAQNARSLRCFFAAEDRMTDLASAYMRRIRCRATLSRRHSCRARRRQRVWRREAADRLFRRYDEPCRPAVRAFQGRRRGPDSLGGNAERRCDPARIEPRKPGRHRVVRTTDSGRGARGAPKRTQPLKLAR
jgi:hypothetical protein